MFGNEPEDSSRGFENIPEVNLTHVLARARHFKQLACWTLTFSNGSHCVCIFYSPLVRQALDEKTTFVVLGG